MTWRAIQSTVGLSESLAALSHLAERLYWRILANTDAYGRLHASPAKLRVQCYALLNVTDEEVGAALLELVTVGRIHVFDDNGTPAIQVVDFEQNQPRDSVRGRGKSRISEPGTLNCGSSAELLRSVWKTPANQQDSGSTAEVLRTTADQKRGEESRRELLKQAAAGHAHAREATPAPTTDAAADLNNILDDLGVHNGLRIAAHQEPDRALACARKAQADATANPAGYFRSLLESGEWPTTAPAPSPRLPVDPVQTIRTLIANRVIQDRVELDAELRAHPALTDADRAALRGMLPAPIEPQPQAVGEPSPEAGVTPGDGPASVLAAVQGAPRNDGGRRDFSTEAIPA